MFLSTEIKLTINRKESEGKKSQRAGINPAPYEKWTGINPAPYGKGGRNNDQGQKFFFSQFGEAIHFAGFHLSNERPLPSKDIAGFVCSIHQASGGYFY
jgi:hypothetical protein